MSALNFDVTGNNNDFIYKMRQVYHAIQTADTKAQAASFSIKDMLRQTAGLAGLSLGAAGLKEFATKMVEVRREIQSFQTSFRVLLGDQQKANAMFNELKQFANTTPMMLKDLSGAAQTMMGFGIESEKVVPILKQIGDVSMGDSQRFNSLVLAFSQMSATGKLMGQDLMQMINAGFNPLNEISRKTGKSISELKDEMSAGAISAEMVADAFQSVTSEGGAMFGMLEQQGQGLNGQINALSGAVQDLFDELGTKAEPIIAGSIQALTELVKNYEAVGKAIAVLITSYGAYRAALIATNVVEATSVLGLKDGVKYLLMSAKAAKAASIAQNIYNAACAANPYVLAATAVVALGTALWAFASKTDKAAEAQENLNNAIADATATYKEEEWKLKDLQKTANDNTKSIIKRKEAIDQINSIVPEYHAKIDKEGKLYDANTKAIERYLKARNVELQMNAISDLKQEQYKAKAQAEAKKAQLQTQQKQENKKATEGGISNIFSNIYHGNRSQALQSEIRDIDKDILEAQNQIDQYQKKTDELQAQLDQINAQSEAQQQTQNKKYWEDLKQKAEADLAALDNVKAAGKEGAAIKAQIAEYDKKIKLYTVGGGGKSSDQTAIDDTMRKQQRENAKLQVQLQQETEQARINEMRDGNEKTLAQLRLNFQKEQQSIDEWYQQLKDEQVAQERELWEKQNPSGKWTTSMQTASEQRAETNVRTSAGATRTAKQGAATAAYREGLRQIAQQEQQHMVEYLKEYGDMQQQRLAIAMDYDQRIAESADQWQRKSLDRQKTDALQQFDTNAQMQAVTSNPDYVEAMIDPSNLGIDALQQLNTLLDKARESLATLPPDQLQAITELMQRIDEQIIQDDPFGTLQRSLDELDTSKIETATAKTEMDIAQAEANSLKAAQAPMETVAAAQDKATKAKNKYINSLNKQKRAENNVKASQTQIAAVLGNLASSMQDVANSASSFGDEASKYISGVASLVNFVGLAVKVTSLSTANAIKTIESASVILAIISAAIQLATQAAELLGFTKDDSSYQKAKAEYDSLVSVWDELIDKKKEYISISWGAEIQAVGDEAKALQQASIEVTRQIAKEYLGAGASAGSHSYGARMNRDLGGYFSTLGITNISQLADKTGEQLQQIKEQNALFWAKLDGDYRDYLQTIIDGYDKIEDLENQIKQQFTQLTFDDMYDNFVDTLMDMNASAADFSDDVSEYFMRALLNQQIGTKYKKQLEKWYDDFASALDANGGTLTPRQTEELQEKYNAIVQGAIDIRNQLADATGYTGDSSSADSGVSASVTQDSIDEANGRMSAIQMGQQTLIAHAIQLVTSAEQTNSTLADILTGNALRNSMMSDIYTRIGRIENNIGDYLQQIADNTKNI